MDLRPDSAKDRLDNCPRPWNGARRGATVMNGDGKVLIFQPDFGRFRQAFFEKLFGYTKQPPLFLQRWYVASLPTIEAEYLNGPYRNKPAKLCKGPSANHQELEALVGCQPEKNSPQRQVQWLHVAGPPAKRHQRAIEIH